MHMPASAMRGIRRQLQYIKGPMLEQCREYIRKHALLQEGQSALLAVSGGPDSMVMTHLFSRMSYPFALAHCNFQLRGKDSDADEELIRQVARERGLEFFCRRFDTLAYARKHRLSVQMAARELRYDWLEELRTKKGFDAVATAHHLDDSIETLLINLLRGTGIDGLKGIPRKKGKVIRPVLFTTRKQIEEYVQTHGVDFRHDATNREEHYARNRLRHSVIPLLKGLNPSLEAVMGGFFNRMEDVSTIYQEAVSAHIDACMRQQGEERHISMEVLLGFPYSETLLYEIVKDFGFSPGQCHDIHKSMQAQAGKLFYSNSHGLLRDRDHLIIFPIVDADETDSYEIPATSRGLRSKTGSLRFDSGGMAPGTPLPDGPHHLMADSDKLDFPLELRRWKAGDTMIPLGMKGRKKVSDLLTEQKIPLHQKKQVMVLTSAGQIVWIVGIRADERFKITPKTKTHFTAIFQKAL